MSFIGERCCSGGALDDALWVDPREGDLVVPVVFMAHDWLLECLCCNGFHV
jgi:hypothetical protein